MYWKSKMAASMSKSFEILGNQLKDVDDRIEKPTLSSDNDSVIRINCQWFKTVAKQVVILPFFWLNMAAPSPHGRSADIHGKG